MNISNLHKNHKKIEHCKILLKITIISIQNSIFLGGFIYVRFFGRFQATDDGDAGSQMGQKICDRLALKHSGGMVMANVLRCKLGFVS